MDFLDSSVTTALEAKRNEARRIERGRDLRRERQAFLSQLTQEREERLSLEAWAASRIQALFRGFLARPRPPRTRPRQTPTPEESNRRLVADLQEILARAGLPTIPGLGPDGRKALGGSEWGRGRGIATREGGPGRIGGGVRRSRSRKQRAFEGDMGTRITKVVRGFLDRKRVGRYRIAWDQERRWAGAVRIQHAWRTYRKRRGWRELESGLMCRAAAKIQGRWRGMACRMALSRRYKEDALRRRKTVSAITIQAAARRRLAVARVGPKLSLGVARREREERAAAEAVKPRRRWNRGIPAAGAAGTDAAIGRGSEREDGQSGGTPATRDRGKGTASGAGVNATSARGGDPARSADTASANTRSVGTEKGVSEGNAAGAVGVQTRGEATAQAGAKPAASKRDAAKGEARDWEHGSHNGDSCGGVDNDGVASVSTTTTANRTGTSRSKDSSTVEEKLAKGGDGVRFAAEVDDSSAQIKRRASQAVSLHFVENSILTAVVNTHTAPPIDSGVALKVSDDLTDIESSAVAAVAAVAPRAGPRGHDLLHTLPAFVE